MIKRPLPLAGTILALVWQPAYGQEAPSPEDVVRAFHEALASGDSVTALGLLAEDVVIYESGGVEASREEYRSHHLPADMAFASATEREVTLERSGKNGDLAWVLSRSTTTGTFREQEIHSVGTETMLLVLTSAGWRIRHIHWSSRRASPPEGG
jgi:ketosteroid isomerase-like protein